MRFARLTPGQDESRTAAAIGADGRQAAPWTLQGVRQVAALTSEQVWQGTAAFPTLPPIGGALEVVSNVASDTSTGSGARQVDVLYLNARFELRLARGKLNGLTPNALQIVNVQTGALGPNVVDAFRVVAVDITLVGVAGINNGEVDVNVATVQQARIVRQTTAITTLMRCRARPGGFTVPAGFCALLDAVDLDAGPVLAVQARPPRMPWMGILGNTQKSFNLVEPPSSGVPDPIVFSTGTDIRLVYEDIDGTVPATTYVAPRVSLYLHPDEGSTDNDPAQIPDLARCGFADP